MLDVVQTTVKLKTKDLFRFMVYDGFYKISGIVTLVFAGLSLIMLPISAYVWHDQFTTIAFGAVVFMYLVLTPLGMFSQAKRQAMTNPVFKNPMTYHISEEIFEVQLFTGTIRLYWSQLVRVSRTRFDYFFFVNEQQAFILPKVAVDPDEVQLLESILEKVSGEIGTYKEEAETETKEEETEKDDE